MNPKGHKKQMNQLSFFGEGVELVSIDPSRNRYRYYSLSIDTIDFTTYTLTKRWGRLKTKYNKLSNSNIKKETELLFSTSSEVQKMFSSIMTSKFKKGYQVWKKNINSETL